MHQRLGWATEPEHVYQGAIQCYYGERCYMRGFGNEVVWFGRTGAGRWPEW